MLIGEVSRKTGFTRDTIRFYEKAGLITPKPSKNIHNTYKDYSDDVLRRLLLIKRIKTFGFTLNETVELIELIEMNAATCVTVTNQVTEKIKVIDQKIKELKSLKKSMVGLLNNCCGTSLEANNCPSLSIITG